MTPTLPNTKGDGVSDDTLALQAAIDETPAGGEVLLPPGKYLITKPLVIKSAITILFADGASLDSSKAAYAFDIADGADVTVLADHNDTIPDFELR